MYADGDIAAAVLGADASVQVVRPWTFGAFGVAANLGVSRTLASSSPSSEGVFYVYPAVIAGVETVYGGVRGIVSLDPSGGSGVGPFVGVRAPASSGVARYYLGLEVAAVRFFGGGDFGDEVSVYPALTFGRRQNR